MRGATRSVELDAYADPAQDTSAGRLRCTATTNFDRRDFGLVWDSPLIKVFDQVAVTPEIDAVQQEQRAPAVVPDGR